MIRLLNFEEKAIRMIAGAHDEFSAPLLDQLASVAVASRLFSGVGVISQLDVPRTTLKCPVEDYMFTADVGINPSDELPTGATCLLVVREGRMVEFNTLTIGGEHWPSESFEPEVSIIDPTRRVVVPKRSSRPVKT